MYKSINFNIFKTLFISFLVFLNVNHSYSIRVLSQSIFNKAKQSAQRMVNEAQQGAQRMVNKAQQSVERIQSALSGHEVNLANAIVTAINSKDTKHLESIFKNNSKICDALCALGRGLSVVEEALRHAKDENVRRDVARILTNCTCDISKDPYAYGILQSIANKFVKGENQSTNVVKEEGVKVEPVVQTKESQNVHPIPPAPSMEHFNKYLEGKKQQRKIEKPALLPKENEEQSKKTMTPSPMPTKTSKEGVKVEPVVQTKESQNVHPIPPAPSMEHFNKYLEGKKQQRKTPIEKPALLSKENEEQPSIKSPNTEGLFNELIKEAALKRQSRDLKNIEVNTKKETQKTPERNDLKSALVAKFQNAYPQGESESNEDFH